MKRGPYKGRKQYSRKPTKRDTDEFHQQHIIDNSTEDANGCRVWNRAKNNLGYGMKSYLGKFMLAHRVSFIVFNGPIPDGLNVLHDCDNPGCVAPHHLYAGTQRRNLADMIARGRNKNQGKIARSSDKTAVKIGVAKANKGSRWFSNSSTEIKLKKGVPAPDGYKPGRTFKARIARSPRPDVTHRNTGKYWCNDGIVNIRVSNSEPVPDGYVKGMLYQRRAA